MIPERVLYDFDGCVNLLGAIAKRWARDAYIEMLRGDWSELEELADWMQVDVMYLYRNLDQTHLFRDRKAAPSPLASDGAA